VDETFPFAHNTSTLEVWPTWIAPGITEQTGVILSLVVCAAKNVWLTIAHAIIQIGFIAKTSMANATISARKRPDWRFRPSIQCFVEFQYIVAGWRHSIGRPFFATSSWMPGPSGGLAKLSVWFG
jgi:hypothetical protein